jgi:hypothetical protein
MNLFEERKLLREWRLLNRPKRGRRPVPVDGLLEWLNAGYQSLYEASEYTRPSQQDLADYLGRSTDTIQRHLHRLGYSWESFTRTFFPS